MDRKDTNNNKSLLKVSFYLSKNRGINLILDRNLKTCHECMIYRHQEYLDGLLNFDDFHCCTLSFTLFLQNFVEVNIEHCL